jgi:putative membrane protein
MGRFLLHIITGILALWLANKYVPGVEFTGPFFVISNNQGGIREFFHSLIFVGTFLGFLTFFIKPILGLITMPLKIITFGLFSLVINLFLVWFTNRVFPELVIANFLSLVWTTLIVSATTIFISAVFPGARKKFF